MERLFLKENNYVPKTELKSSLSAISTSSDRFCLKSTLQIMASKLEYNCYPEISWEFLRLRGFWGLNKIIIFLIIQMICM